MKILAIITARSGSKGIPDKNIKPLCGHPLCAYTIKAAKESAVFSEIHFSTDSQLYADIAGSYGAAVPFLRDKELANDTASSWDVVKAVVKKYEEMGEFFDAVMLLQPTTPLRTAEDIRNALDLMIEKNANAIVSVVPVKHPLQWCAALPPDGNLSIYHERRQYLVPRQLLPTSYICNGAIYLVKIPYLFSCSDIYEKESYAYFMPEERSMDIDSQFDFDLCEFMMKRKSEEII